MNRFVLPPPSSDERDSNGRRVGWQDALQGFVHHTIGDLVEAGVLDGADLRAKVIAIAREALGDTGTGALVERTKAVTPTAGDYSEVLRNFDGLPGVLRLIIEKNVPDWSDPMVVESIMIEVQRALDTDFTHRLEQSGRIVATASWHDAGKPPVGRRDDLLDQVVTAAREGLAANLEDNSETDESGLLWVSTRGVFQMVFRGLDMTIPGRARALIRGIKQAARDELQRAVPGAPDARTA